MLLTELAQKFPPKSFPAAHQVQPVAASSGPAEKIGSLDFCQPSAVNMFTVCCWHLSFVDHHFF